MTTIIRRRKKENEVGEDDDDDKKDNGKEGRGGAQDQTEWKKERRHPVAFNYDGHSFGGKICTQMWGSLNGCDSPDETRNSGCPLVTQFV